MFATLGLTNNNSELLASSGLRCFPAVTSESPRATRNPGFLISPGTVAVMRSLGLLTSSQRVICAEQRIKQEQEAHFHRPPISVSSSKVHVTALVYARQHYFRTTERLIHPKRLMACTLGKGFNSCARQRPTRTESRCRRSTFSIRTPTDRRRGSDSVTILFSLPRWKG